MALGGSAARRYAEALYDIASGEGTVPDYRASLERIAAALGPETIRALRDPRISLERRRAALAAAATGEPRAVRGVLDLLLQRDRIGIVAAIAAAFGDLVDAREGIVKARITTPVEIGERQRGELVARLEAASGKKVRASFAVDTALLGGAKVQIGDRLIDTTLRTQLNALARQLAGS